ELLDGYREVPLSRPRGKQTHKRIYNGVSWRLPMPAWVRRGRFFGGFRRGFPASAWIEGPGLLQLLSAPEKLWRHPPIEELDIDAGDLGRDRRQVRQILRLLRGLKADLGRIHKLWFHGDWTDELASAFLLCPRLHGLRQLDLGNRTLGDPTLQAL